MDQTEQTTQTESQTTTNEQTEQTQSVTPALFDEQQDNSQDSSEASNQQDNNSSDPNQDNQENQNQSQQLTEQDIKIPEGFTYDKEVGASFLGILNDEKLSRKELAQKLTDLYHAQNVKMLEALKAADSERLKKFESDMATEKSEWLKQCQSDKEYGGQNWEAAQSIIDRGCRQLATPEAVSLMQRYNLNTHPEIVRMFYRAGKLASEDKSGIEGNGQGKTQDIAMAIFGESLKDYHKRKGEL
ncbi:MAG: hypothetical protein IJT21_05775 [Synergistaceae bacterium]|nr:hypothetical protein [Synergistaceae bacterium]